MARREGLVVVARGDGWALAWPRAEWEALDAEERRQVIARQAALLSQNVAQNRTQTSKPRAIRGGAAGLQAVRPVA